ncbi:MAG: tetraacyldisaccharide 4'-kinase [Pirellulaceae bacterium]|nr:tetraacyldisaccharide 4'-kinase [Pirellulaceae bacterium]
MHWRDVISGKANGLGPSSIRLVLFLASQLYALVVKSRNWLYDRGWKKAFVAPVPVISIGNLTVGGTGKTPTVAMLAQWFRRRDIRVAILSRGYGAGADGRNDEARELEGKLDDVPHLQDPDRCASATIACEELATQILLLDDGFQHRRLARNLDVVLLDASEPFGYGFLLPRGLLREGIRSLRRAHIVMLTRCDIVAAQRLADIRTQVQRIAPKIVWVETEHRPSKLKNTSGEEQSIEWLEDRKCFVFSAIGNPSAFLETVRKCGAVIVDSHAFQDHHAFTSSDVQLLRDAVKSNPNIECVLCTGKDLAKIDISVLGERPLWMLEIAMTIRIGQEAFEERLVEMIGHIPATEL